MAEPIAEFTDDRMHGNRKYPWEVWTDGRIWQATAPDDFTTTPASFRSALSNHASHHGLRVTTRVYRDGIVEFQFTTREQA